MMPNLSLYLEARECLEQLHATAAGSRPADHPLACPEELFAELEREQQSALVYDKLVSDLFDTRRTSRPEYVY
jgi:hypothetical protein